MPAPGPHLFSDTVCDPWKPTGAWRPRLLTSWLRPSVVAIEIHEERAYARISTEGDVVAGPWTEHRWRLARTLKDLHPEDPT